MAELYGLSLAQHLDNILTEVRHRQSIYGYPLKKVFRPDPTLDLSVRFHGKRAATPLGPASGPHTQMVQNIVLAFLGGSRIMELKTVQIMDRLEIPRPCIDMRNIGYNVEWSQELRLEDSYHEYVTAWILLKIIEEMELLGVPKGDPFYDTVFDLSVGYDLKGIATTRVTNWIRDMMNAESSIRERLQALPDRYASYRDFQIQPVIANTLTLSTFHGCPRDEIQSIVEYLIGDLNLDVLIKMNPTQLGYDRVRQILNEDLGYKHLRLDRKAFDEDLQFEEAVAMMKRLERFAAERGRRTGAKFTNTLVVKNHDSVFSDKVMYLSGTPLHVLAMNAMLRFREAVGARIPISFSAGVDHENFVDSVLCGLVPVTTCSDLLGKGGYTRQVNYLKKLERAMVQAGCRTHAELLIGASKNTDLSPQKAGLANARGIVPKLLENPKYRAEKNDKLPKKIGSQLEFFDCLTCNICLPVCPNAANFSIPIGKLSKQIEHYAWDGSSLVPVEKTAFNLTKPEQIANLADFCNECGNCDTFCPEDGGPFIEKPRFFSSESTYRTYSDYDGFYFPEADAMTGRIGGVEYNLMFDSERDAYRFTTPLVRLTIGRDDRVIEVTPIAEISEGGRFDMTPFHGMKVLFEGISRTEDYPSVMLRGDRSP